MQQRNYSQNSDSFFIILLAKDGMKKGTKEAMRDRENDKEKRIGCIGFLEETSLLAVVSSNPLSFFGLYCCKNCINV